MKRPARRSLALAAERARRPKKNAEATTPRSASRSPTSRAVAPCGTTTTHATGPVAVARLEELDGDEGDRRADQHEARARAIDRPPSGAAAAPPPARGRSARCPGPPAPGWAAWSAGARVPIGGIVEVPRLDVGVRARGRLTGRRSGSGSPADARRARAADGRRVLGLERTRPSVVGDVRPAAAPPRPPGRRPRGRVRVVGVRRVRGGSRRARPGAAAGDGRRPPGAAGSAAPGSAAAAASRRLRGERRRAVRLGAGGLGGQVAAAVATADSLVDGPAPCSTAGPSSRAARGRRQARGSTAPPVSTPALARRPARGRGRARARRAASSSAAGSCSAAGWTLGGQPARPPRRCRASGRRRLGRGRRGVPRGRRGGARARAARPRGSAALRAARSSRRPKRDIARPRPSSPWRASQSSSSTAAARESSPAPPAGAAAAIARREALVVELDRDVEPRRQALPRTRAPRAVCAESPPDSASGSPTTTRPTSRSRTRSRCARSPRASPGR